MNKPRLVSSEPPVSDEEFLFAGTGCPSIAYSSLIALNKLWH
ncbi:hypothetical protein [uncultured Shewanella sp.]|nr:hypothetical protein [uncultured Shewanella sp.]